MFARKFFWRLAALAFAVFVVPVRGQEPGSPAGHKYALLIGCTAYPALAENYQLKGPGNDVALTAELLRERFGYTDGEIVTLVYANEESLQPTNANIFREFAALIDRVVEGDRVFILIAGHGSQQTNDDPDYANDEELDGLDEVFLPQDITAWEYDKPVVNAIRDDQFRTWLDGIRAGGASVFFVADTCHSGTMDRSGAPDENAYSRSRWVDPAVINGPRDPQREDGEGAEVSDAAAPAGLAELEIDPDEDLPGLVALYAVDDQTEELEHPMPPDNRLDGPSYGQLTYAMNWVLARSKRPLTYRELAQQICWRYENWKWQDIGFILGSKGQLDFQVLGEGLWKDRSAITLYRDEEYQRLSINAGLLHGATVGTTYTVFPPTGFEGDDVPVGCVRVTEATPTTARVEACAFGDIPEVAGDALPAPGRCELAFVAATSLKLSVGVAALYSENRTTNLAGVEGVVRELAAMPAALIRQADEGEQPDALLLVQGKDIYLRRAVAAGSGTDAPHTFGPFAADVARVSPLSVALDLMAKAENIRRLATSTEEIIVGNPDDPAVTLRVVVERRNAETGKFEEIDRMKPITAQNLDTLRVSVFNDSGAPVDVTILYVDSAFGIVSYFPTAAQNDRGGFNNRLVPEGAPAVCEFTIDATTTVGLEDVLIVATLAQRESTPQNFVFLEQKGLPRGKNDPRSALGSPLGQLLATAAFGSSDRGGSAAPDIAKYALHRLSWTVLPPPGGAAPPGAP